MTDTPAGHRVEVLSYSGAWRQVLASREQHPKRPTKADWQQLVSVAGKLLGVVGVRCGLATGWPLAVLFL